MMLMFERSQMAFNFDPCNVYYLTVIQKACKAAQRKMFPKIPPKYSRALVYKIYYGTLFKNHASIRNGKCFPKYSTSRCTITRYYSISKVCKSAQWKNVSQSTSWCTSTSSFQKRASLSNGKMFSKVLLKVHYLIVYSKSVQVCTTGNCFPTYPKTRCTWPIVYRRLHSTLPYSTQRCSTRASYSNVNIQLLLVIFWLLV
jgi:hypothetical protein